MKFYNILRDKSATLLMAPALLFLLASCGSYQYSGYGNDGIYGDTPPANNQNETGYYGTRPAQPQQQVPQEQSNSQYYKDLFGEKSAQYESVPTQGAIFTDIEGYTSNAEYSDDVYYEDQGTEYNDGGYGPWGSEATSVNVNYYGNYMQPMFYYPSWNRGWYGGFAYDPYWGGGFYNGWGWGWGMNFGYSPMYYGGFYSPFHYGYGYPYYGAGYLPYNRRNNVAYNVGRRNSYSNYNNSRVNSYNSRSSYSRNSINAGRSSRSNNYDLMRGDRSQSRSRIDANTPRRQSPSINNRTRSNNEYSAPSRRNTTTRSQSTPTRSSGTISRGSSGRSSGGATRSGGGGGRRGGR